MMKRLFSKLRRKLGVSPETPNHPDLNPPSDWDVPESEYSPGTSQAVAGSEPDELPAAAREAIEDNVHPDLHLIESQILAEDFPHNPRAEAPIQSDVSISGHQPSTAEAFTELEAENDVSANHEPDPDPGLALPNPDSLSLSAELELVEANDEYDELIGDNDVFDQQADDLWEGALSYEAGEEIERARTDGDSFEVTDFYEFQEFGPGETENETESAQWEDLLDMDLYEEDPDLLFPFIEEETITDGHLLDDYAARLVSQMRIIKLDQRALLQGRFKAVLEEFPFSSSYRALSRLVQAGNSLAELEDACELKCLWRESPWLWSHRKFNKMQRAWETEERSSYRSALSWKLALTLIRRVGRAEAERRIVDDWRNEWLQMQLEHSSEGVRIDPRFWSYPAFLNLNEESIELADSEAWYYEEPIDIHPWSSFRLEDSEGQIWRFEPKEERCDTGFLSLLPHSKRVAAKEEAEAKEAGKDA
ncbi:hypothetical protein [Hoeflea sp.]|uniref:hypothetical protein n=1 Tax=Hoeflea sp. TaxID=1940281 RepID=UPI0019AA23FF|nr:hypothetical protein [Hoeflea sp.]MBC7284438.1 hypothetical protein [Hoeflea sp.]